MHVHHSHGPPQAPQFDRTPGVFEVAGFRIPYSARVELAGPRCRNVLLVVTENAGNVARTMSALEAFDPTFLATLPGDTEPCLFELGDAQSTDGLPYTVVGFHALHPGAVERLGEETDQSSGRTPRALDTLADGLPSGTLYGWSRETIEPTATLMRSLAQGIRSSEERCGVRGGARGLRRIARRLLGALSEVSVGGAEPTALDEKHLRLVVADMTEDLARYVTDALRIEPAPTDAPAADMGSVHLIITGMNVTHFAPGAEVNNQLPEPSAEPGPSA